MRCRRTSYLGLAGDSSSLRGDVIDAGPPPLRSNESLDSGDITLMVAPSGAPPATGCGVNGRASASATVIDSGSSSRCSRNSCVNRCGTRKTRVR
jgi:hypothetical protein